MIWPTPRAVITTVFRTLWLASYWVCVWGQKSLNNGMRTDGIFWRSSYATLASRLPHFHLCSPEMPKELHLFCRLGLYRILCFFHLHAVKNIIIEKKDIFFSGLFFYMQHLGHCLLLWQVPSSHWKRELMTYHKWHIIASTKLCW